jgi:uncharacterized protein YegJ (DUF2314 family)
MANPLTCTRTRIGAAVLLLAPWLLSCAPSWAADTTGTTSAASSPTGTSAPPSGGKTAASSAAIQALVESQKKATEEAASREEPALEIDEQDPAMRAAFKQAQATLNDFLKVAAKRNPKPTSPAMRVGIQEGERKEFLWITPFQTDGKGFKGTIDNAPTQLKRVKEGQPWRFQRKDVVDWMYIDAATGVMHGNRTTCVQLAKAPPAEVEQVKRAYGLDCQSR